MLAKWRSDTWKTLNQKLSIFSIHSPQISPLATGSLTDLQPPRLTRWMGNVYKYIQQRPGKFLWTDSAKFLIKTEKEVKLSDDTRRLLWSALQQNKSSETCLFPNTNWHFQGFWLPAHNTWLTRNMNFGKLIVILWIGHCQWICSMSFFFQVRLCSRWSYFFQKKNPRVSFLACRQVDFDSGLWIRGRITSLSNNKSRWKGWTRPGRLWSFAWGTGAWLNYEKLLSYVSTVYNLIMIALDYILLGNRFPNKSWIWDWTDKFVYEKVLTAHPIRSLKSNVFEWNKSVGWSFQNFFHFILLFEV